eukprot:m.12478 g.12478  ORF g.12478 m.12478 type:complete len:50 (+) comp9312_c0_seq2:691-840(+)
MVMQQRAVTLYNPGRLGFRNQRTPKASVIEKLTNDLCYRKRDVAAGAQR